MVFGLLVYNFGLLIKNPSFLVSWRDFFCYRQDYVINLQQKKESLVRLLEPSSTKIKQCIRLIPSQNTKTKRFIFACN